MSAGDPRLGGVPEPLNVKKKIRSNKFIFSDRSKELKSLIVLTDNEDSPKHVNKK